MRATLVALLLMLGAACGTDGVTEPETNSFAGTYQLQSINGARLPYVAIRAADTTVSIVSDELTIDSGGTWSESTRFETTRGPQAWTTIGGNNGTWIRSGNSIVFSSTKNNNTQYIGTFSANRLDLVYGSTPFLFIR